MCVLCSMILFHEQRLAVLVILVSAVESLLLVCSGSCTSMQITVHEATIPGFSRDREIDCADCTMFLI
jgi:hypothetical protein